MVSSYLAVGMVDMKTLTMHITTTKVTATAKMTTEALVTVTAEKMKHCNSWCVCIETSKQGQHGRLTPKVQAMGA